MTADRHDDRTHRRAVLGLLGTGAAALAGCSAVLGGERPPEGPAERTPAADPGRRTAELADSYGTVVDMVADAGCDPTGEAPCAEAVRAAAGDDTLLVFPPGSYLIEEPVELFGLEDVGIRGDGDVTLVAPPGHNENWIVVDRGRGLLFENVDVDARAEDAAPTLLLGVEDGLEVRDVEVLGRGTREASRDDGATDVTVGNSLLPVVRSPDGTGLVERYVATEGGRIGTYNGGHGRIGIYVGRSHFGTLRIVDCHLEEFPNNGIYASRTNGVVEVVGGRYRNNDVSQVRLGSEGSLVEGATVEVDPETVGGPNEPGDYRHPRGIRIESGTLDTAGVTVRDVDVRIANSSAGGVSVGRHGGRFRVEDAHIRVESGNADAIIAKRPTGGSDDPPPAPHHATIEGVRVTGDAAAGASIRLFDRPGSTVRDTVVEGAGDRDGIVLVGSPATVADTEVSGGRYPLVVVPGGRDPASAADGIDPERLVSDRCLATLERVAMEGGADGPVEVLATPSETPLGSLLSPAGSFCLPADLALEAEFADAVVAVTGTGIDGVYGRVVPRDGLGPYA